MRRGPGFFLQQTGAGRRICQISKRIKSPISISISSLKLLVLPHLPSKSYAPVPAAVFGLIEGHVRKFDSLPEALGVQREFADAQADRLFKDPGGHIEFIGFHFSPYLFRYSCGFAFGNVHKNDEKLLAPEPDDQVSGPDAIFKYFSRFLKYRITGVVAVDIVDLLEEIEAAHDEPDILAPQQDARHLTFWGSEE